MKANPVVIERLKFVCAQVEAAQRPWKCQAQRKWLAEQRAVEDRRWGFRPTSFVR